MYGSKMGIIDGTSGDWLLNVTNSPSLAFQTLNNFTDISCKFPSMNVSTVSIEISKVACFSGPTKLNYTRVLETIFAYLNKTWEDNQKHQRIGNLGQVVVLLIPLGYMSNDDKHFALTLLQQIKYNHPGEKHEVLIMN